MNIQPLCPVFGECGGCAYQDISYEKELERKDALVKDLLQKDPRVTNGLFEPIVASPKPYHYRNRLDLKFIRTRDDRTLLGFTPGSGRGIAAVEGCAIAEKSISEFIPELRKRLEQNPIANYRRANIVIRTGDDRKVLWGGIGKRSCRLNPDNYLWTILDGKKIFYSLDTFFQANLSILPKLFERIRAFDCWQTKPVLYDLHAGVGLFSLALTQQTRKAVLIEESLPSIKLAEHNVEYNRLTHMEILAGRMEEVLPPLLARDNSSSLRPKAPRGEPNGAIPKVAIIDPPRAGLSPPALETLVHAKGFTHLFYLSCNPQALARDLKGFIDHGWSIQKVIPFDFFPKTKHVETLVLLSPE
jgi:23S rRNA (uracil1939-C5)-methyltransferase/tRNA (uracil-5-)-methyltransferase